MKKCVIGVFLVFSIFLLTACEKKSDSKEIIKAHSDKEIKKIINKNDNYNILDVNANEDGNYYAVISDKNGNKISYNTYNDEKLASNFYDYNYKYYSSKKSDGDTVKEVKNTYYELTTSNEYYYVIYDKNVVVNVNCKLESKDSVIKILKDIDYYYE